MTASMFIEQRFYRTPDGAVWTSAGYARPFWDRYLETFSAMTVVARVLDVPQAEPGWDRVDGRGVSVHAVPHYIGPAAFVRRLGDVRRAVVRGADRSGAMLLRSGLLSMIAARWLHARGRPYAVEVVGDPYDVFAPGVVEHPLRPFFRWWFTREQRLQCARAQAALYVTEAALQRRYPCPGHSVGVSDVVLGPDATREAPRTWAAGAPRRLVFVGSLQQLYKAPDVLVRAFAACTGAGLDVRLALVGDGKHRAEIEALAAELGVADRVAFSGELLAGDAIRDQLDRSDLFVLPSRTEGMPRALIEAMARGLPCIASSVGGIPELLGADALIPPGDVDALAQRIQDIATDPARMAAMSAANLARARDYGGDALDARRRAFYEYVRDHALHDRAPAS